MEAHNLVLLVQVALVEVVTDLRELEVVQILELMVLVEVEVETLIFMQVMVVMV